MTQRRTYQSTTRSQTISLNRVPRQAFRQGLIQGPIQSHGQALRKAHRESPRQSLRQSLRQKRRSLSRATQRQHGQSIARHLSHNIAFLKARNVGIYWPTDGEVDLAHLNRISPKNLYWPVLQEQVRPWQGRGLLFAADHGCWQKNRYGIPEPKTRRLIRARDLDCLLIPLVGFDLAGNRLGMGGGYYDRTLAQLPRWRVTRLIGIAHDTQQVQKLAINVWDIPMHGIATESGIRIGRKKAWKGGL